MKFSNYIAFILLLVVFSSCGDIISKQSTKYNLTDVPTADKYRDGVFQSSHKKASVQKEGSRELNDEISLSIYIPEYTAGKGKTVCRFYKEYYKTLANKLEGRLIVEISVFNSKNVTNATDIKKDISYKGGMVMNYTNEDYKENVY